MKNIIRHLAGLASSLFHTLGFVRLAEKLDPLVSHVAQDRRSSEPTDIAYTCFRPL